MHYKLNTKRGSPFWEYCQNMSVPEDVQNALTCIALMVGFSALVKELFAETSWLQSDARTKVCMLKVITLGRSLEQVKILPIFLIRYKDDTQMCRCDANACGVYCFALQGDVSEERS